MLPSEEMARPPSDDPKQRVSLSLRRSTVARIEERLTEGQTIGMALSAAVEAKYGLTDPAALVESMFKK